VGGSGSAGEPQTRSNHPRNRRYSRH
jgi:hypothetical protein